MSDAGLDPQRSVLLSQGTPFTLDVSAASFSTMPYDVEDNPGKALEIAFASQVSRNTEVLPFGKIKTIDIIQYQYCSEIAVIMIGKKKKSMNIMNLKIRLPSKQIIRVGSAVFSFIKISLSLEV